MSHGEVELIRLEGVNKRFGTQALISHETLAATDGSLAVRPLGSVQVVGRAEPVAGYELLGTAGETTALDPATVERFFNSGVLPRWRIASMGVYGIRKRRPG